MTTEDWKLVQQALPPKGMMVLAYNKDSGTMAMARLTNNGWNFTDGKPFRGVTHWRMIVLPRETDA